MSYGNSYSNKPFERASKTAHTAIINDVEVANFLSKCTPPPYENTIEDGDFGEDYVSEMVHNPIKNIIAIDGGYTDVIIRKQFPSWTMAFFQFGPLFFKVKDLKSLENKPFIDPSDMAKLQDINRIKLVLPTRGIMLDGEQDFVSSFRKTLNEFFQEKPAGSGFIQALKWLLFEEYLEVPKSHWILASCPVCSDAKNVRLDRESMEDNYVFTCEKCNGQIYLTDVFRLHEVVDNELGASGVLGYVTTLIEQMIVVYLVREVLLTKPAMLNEILFIKDGPLAFFGQTANLHKPMRRLIQYLNKGKYTIHLVGLEKSGPFVEHAAQISDKLEHGQALLLSDQYIYKYILPGRSADSKPYGSSSYYGSKVIFKSSQKDVYVATLPNLEQKAQFNKDDLLNFDVVLNNVSLLRCDLYSNSLIPVVLANKLVSLANRPSSDILKNFAQDNIQK